MIDYNKYVGIPWVCGKSELDGADCWGIVCMVYQEMFNIKLAHFPARSIDSNNKTMDMIENRKENDNRWMTHITPIEGDVVMMYGKLNKRPIHIGVYIGKGMILHSVERESGVSGIHKLSVLTRMFHKIEFYRYVG